MIMLKIEAQARAVQSQKWSAAAGQRLTALLLDWFARSARFLPWRQNKDPYPVWLSEIMLQQTQVQTVIPYYQKFLETWPTLAKLAAASEEQVLKQWEGLGYYSRARNLLSAARLVINLHQGQFPSTEKDLLSLPGIGEYTAGAILSIAFGKKMAAVDGNVVRVFSRLTAIPWQPADPDQRREVRRFVENLLPDACPGDWNEAMMDLGATICRPRQPQCPMCPLNEICQARQLGIADQLPMKPAKKPVPVKKLVVLVFSNQGRFHVHQRQGKGLLAGLFEFDWFDWGEAAAKGDPDPSSIQAELGKRFPKAAIRPLGPYTHAFTHLQWQMDAFLITLASQAPFDGQLDVQSHDFWATPEQLQSLPFPKALDGYRQKLLPG